MTQLHFDCFSGVSGDMILGAIVDAGLPFKDLVHGLKSVPLDTYELKCRAVMRGGLAATKVEVVVREGFRSPVPLSRIQRIIASSQLPAGVKDRSREVFDRLARAEGAAHRVSPSEVQFHEIGAVDSLVDVMGGVLGCHLLGVERATASSVNLGSGVVDSAHGTLPVPGPAVALLARGVPVHSAGPARELTTPTGMALLSALVGFYLPGIWLGRKIAARRSELARALPDALDLLIVCIEAGLALDQALLKVSEELALSHPALAEELQTVTNEVRAGKPRIEAFRNFADRTRVDEVRALVAMLVQTDRFGTSIAQALRIHAETARTTRRQHAEERAAKLRDPSLREAMKRDVLDRPHPRTDWSMMHVAQATQERNLKYEGLTMAEIAQQQGKHPLDAFLDLALDESAANGLQESGLPHPVGAFHDQKLTLALAESLERFGDLDKLQPPPHAVDLLKQVEGRLVRDHLELRGISQPVTP